MDSNQPVEIITPVEEPVVEAPVAEPVVETTPVVPVVRPASWITREPVAVQFVIQSALAMAIGFGLNWSTEQMGLVLVFTSAVLGLITRQQVTPFEATGVNPTLPKK